MPITPKQVKLLEEELEAAVGRAMRRLAKARKIDRLPPPRVFHFMAKAAVAAYEAADELHADN